MKRDGKTRSKKRIPGCHPLLFIRINQWEAIPQSNRKKEGSFMDKQNENTSELNRKQMEKVSGGVVNPDSLIRQCGTDCFLCKGTVTDPLTGATTICNHSLQQIRGTLYRCVNPDCSMFTKDQYPSAK